MTAFNLNKCLLSIYYMLFLGAIGCKSFPSDTEYLEELANSAPLILEKTNQFERGIDIVLHCEHHLPIEWLWQNKGLEHEIQHYIPDDPSRSQGVQLTLKNVTHLNVDFYFCVEKDLVLYYDELNFNVQQLLDLEKQNRASHIYTYVDDPYNFLAGSPMRVVYTSQGETSIIPCRPSLETHEVQLFINDVLHTITKASDYDPQLGFKIVFLEVGDLKAVCKPIYPNHSEQVEITILVHPALRHNDMFINNNTSNLTIMDNRLADNVFESSSENHFHKLMKRAQALRSSSNNRLSSSRSHNYILESPTISSESKGHAVVNTNFTLTCEVFKRPDVSLEGHWIIPTHVDQQRVRKTPFELQISEGKAVSTLTVFNTQKHDTGPYECSVKDHSENTAHSVYHMKIMSENESYIELQQPSHHYNISQDANRKVRIDVSYNSYPPSTIRWYKTDNGVKTEILTGHKYNVTVEDKSSMLSIFDTQMSDTGVYIVEAKNGLTKFLEFNVTITDKPVATLQDVYAQEGQEAEAICHIVAIPYPTVSWRLTSCTIGRNLQNCYGNSIIMNSSLIESGSRIIDYTHHLYFKPNGPGKLECLVSNDKGPGKNANAYVYLLDINSKMMIYGVDDNTKIARGENIIITCAASVYHFSEKLHWYKNNIIVEDDENMKLSTERTKYSFHTSLSFKSIDFNDAGTYECRATPLQDTREESKFIDLSVHEPYKPTIVQTNLNYQDLNQKIGSALELDCKVDGIPAPNIVWYKDDMELNASAHDNWKISKDNTELIVGSLMPGDEGVYKCVASNSLGSVDAAAELILVDLPGIAKHWIFGTALFIIFLIVLVIYLIMRVRRERRLLKELRDLGLEHFEEGDLEQLNPALSLDEQGHLLPYDRNFEFPREKLKLGKQLGAGAFGVVLKAYAEGIKPDEKETVVAVKMVKSSDDEVQRALVSELKIMIHLGQHLNVVNLLGAVTTKIVKRDFMVIVEYCRYGNVQNVLLKNRKHFVNQINPQTDKIDPNYVCKRSSDVNESSRNGLRYVNVGVEKHLYINELKNHVSNNYTNHSSSDGYRRSGTRSGRPNSSGYIKEIDLYEGKIDSCHTVMTTMPDEDSASQPAWRSNYTEDSHEYITVSTSDLVSWAFQVARGMDYLSSKRVLHGDLAARNILLCEDNVVKICDFGLARTMYNSNTYKKEGVGKLPIKWLALESFSDKVFSTYTDVWSYGIVLWEFFSLAKVPYPGVPANDMLYLKLKDGYRMEKPPYANDELYDIMLECWSANPESRPLFNVLEKRFARMLGDEVTNHYLDLEEPYLLNNIDRAAKLDIYLHTHPGSPTEVAPAPPEYINGRLLPKIRIECSSDDYLNMNKSTEEVNYNANRLIDKDNTTTTNFVFPEPDHSPTLRNNLDSPSKKNLRKENIEPEEIPMLERHENNDNLKEYLDDDDDDRKGVPKPSPRLIGENNYVNVNMKSPQKVLNNTKNFNGRSTDAFSNPNYQPIRQYNQIN